MYSYLKKDNGVFLDVGANHPQKINNTFLLEEHGWTGLAFEPQMHLNQLWKNMRKTECLPYACGKENKKVQFKECASDTLSGVAFCIEEAGNVVEIEQVRIADVLREKNITYIDYMSLDVEGYEFEVLDGIDFDAVAIKLISIENNKSGKRGELDLREYMRNKGYKYIAHVVIDDFFVKE